MRGARVAIACCALLSLLAAGCEKTETGPKTADFQKQRAEIVARRQAARGQAARPAQPAQAARPEGESNFGAVDPATYAYDPIGKRDPFRSFVLDRLKELESATKGPLEQFDLGQLTVLGVVWEIDNRRALIADPSGQGYIVRVGDPIGTNQGKVLNIEDNLVLVRESYIDHMGEQTTKEVEMRVRRNLEG